MSNLPAVTEETMESVLSELESAFYDIPFENSDYQNQVFVVSAQHTPARAYRAVGLRMFAKIQTVKDYQFTQAMDAINIEEKEAKIADPATSDFDRRRLRLEIMRLEDARAWNAKLLNDVLRELNCLYAEFVKLPKYTRAQFEAEEEQHFVQRLTRQLEHGGPRESLMNMANDRPQWEARIAQAMAALPAPRKD